MAKDFNLPKVIDGYDDHIRKLIPGYELAHLHVNALLKTYLPEQSKILIVGCGTGYELCYLAEKFPQWTFTAIDPAENMLVYAQQEVQRLGFSDRVEFILGDTTVLIEDSKNRDHFDASLAILVAHFVPEKSKINFFKDIFESLKNNGLCLSYDLMQVEQHDNFDILNLGILKNLAQETGLTEKQSQVMIDRLADDFDLVSVNTMLDIYQSAGFSDVRTFMQAFAYYGLFAFKKALP